MKHLADIQCSTLISACFSSFKSSWVEKILVRTFLDLAIILQFEDQNFLDFIKCCKGSAFQHLGWMSCLTITQVVL